MTSDYGKRIDRLEAAIAPTVTVSVEVQRQAEHLAERLGISADELLADAARIAVACPGVPGEKIESRAAQVADRLGIPVDEFLADLERLE